MNNHALEAYLNGKIWKLANSSSPEKAPYYQITNQQPLKNGDFQYFVDLYIEPNGRISSFSIIVNDFMEPKNLLKITKKDWMHSLAHHSLLLEYDIIKMYALSYFEDNKIVVFETPSEREAYQKIRPIPCKEYTCYIEEGCFILSEKEHGKLRVPLENIFNSSATMGVESAICSAFEQFITIYELIISSLKENQVLDHLLNVIPAYAPIQNRITLDGCPLNFMASIPKQDVIFYLDTRNMVYLLHHCTYYNFDDTIYYFYFGGTNAYPPTKICIEKVTSHYQDKDWHQVLWVDADDIAFKTLPKYPEITYYLEYGI